MSTDALTAAAEDLYAVVPEEFTAARNARAKEEKAGDRELGQRIGELRKPSPGAWIVNQLVRQQAEAIEELLDLGADLREAQDAGDGKALTGIGTERRKLVSALLKRANELAEAADRSPSRAVLDEVEQTLIAATVDEAAGEALRTGRLVRSLQAVGFEDVDLDGAVAGEASAARPERRRAARLPRREKRVDTEETGAATRHDEREDAARAERERAEREHAETDVREARERAEQAQRALTESEDLLHAAEWNADELRDERHELETRLKELRSEIADAERDEREAERVRAKAAIAVDRAREDVEAAETALERLD